MSNILVVDDSAVDRSVVRRILVADPLLFVSLAEDGAEAVNRLAEQPIELVVTDLQMPELDGLQLVTYIRLHYPHIPVVLMTAQGSEQIAVDALEAGASSYVPKALLNDRLLHIVHELLNHVHADQTYRRLLACFDSTEFSVTLENRAELIDPLVDLVEQMVAGIHHSDAISCYRVGVALREVLLNAVYRGNLELDDDELEASREELLAGQGLQRIDDRRSQAPYNDRRVHVKLCINRDELRFVVRDDGAGFDRSRFPVDAAAFPDLGHRSATLIRAFMDDVQFSEPGNEITLRKFRTPKDRPTRVPT